MKGLLLTTKKELKEILKDVPKMEGNTQFIINIERKPKMTYFQFKGE